MDDSDKSKIDHEIIQDGNQLIIIDKQGRKLFLSQRIGDSEWGTFFKKQSGSLCRIKSYHLPMRKDKAQAERDLMEFARKGELEVK